MNEEDDYEYNITDINIHSFNNKADKGDHDFEDWLVNAAPFVPDSTTGTFAEGSSSYESITAIDNSYNYSTDTITLTNGSNVSFPVVRGDRKKLKDLKYSMPVDLIYKWFPDQKEEDNFDDEIPF